MFSHETALALHELSDVLPGTIHLTLPAHDAKRRLRVPPGVELHFDDVEGRHRTEPTARLRLTAGPFGPLTHATTTLTPGGVLADSKKRVGFLTHT